MPDQMFNNFLNSITDQLYSFSYTLIPDTLQSEQIVLDSLSSLFVDINKQSGSVSLDNISLNYKEIIKLEDFTFIRLILFEKVYSLCKLRRDHLINSIYKLNEKNKEVVFTLDIKSRAALYLKHRLNLSYSKVSSVMNLNKFEVISIINNARYELLDKFDQKNNNDNNLSRAYGYAESL
jgi:hypothetical protein